MYRIFMLILSMTVLGCSASPQLQQGSSAIAVSDEVQNKYALVIGNAAYTTISKLKNPLNDANDMTSVLKGLGFTVDKVLDGTREEMETAVLRLKKRLSESRNTYGFLFYAGHGVQSVFSVVKKPTADDDEYSCPCVWTPCPIVVDSSSCFFLAAFVV